MISRPETTAHESHGGRATAIGSLAMGACAAALLAGTVAHTVATAEAQTRWEMATPYPESEHHTINIREFAEDVAEKTDGALEIQVHSGQSLFRAPEIPRAVQTGQVQLGEFLIGNMENENPLFGVDSIPFLATSFEEAQALYEAQEPFLNELLEERGMRLLFSVPWPSQGFYTKEEITSLDDLEGTRFRTYNAPTARMAELMGASPTIIEAVEIPQSFAAGIVDAMATSAATGVRNNAWDYANYFYDVGAWFPKNMVVVNEAAFQQLPEDQQQAVLEAAEAAEPRGWEMAREVSEETVRELDEQGMEVQEASDELLGGLRDVGNTMREEWIEAAGDEGAQLIEDYEARRQ